MATRRPTPQAPRDSFEGAEESARDQGRTALEYMSQYGKQGLRALVNQRRAVAGQAGALAEDVSSITRDFGAPPGLRAELAAKARSALAPYARDARVARQGYDEDLRATLAANRTYYDQVAQAVPMERSGAQRTVAEYRTAWEENESRRVAEEEQRELARRQQEEAMAFARQQQAQQVAMAEAARAQAASQFAQSQAWEREKNAAALALERRKMELAYPGPAAPKTTVRRGPLSGRGFGGR